MPRLTVKAGEVGTDRRQRKCDRFPKLHLAVGFARLGPLRMPGGTFYRNGIRCGTVQVQSHSDRGRLKQLLERVQDGIVSALL